MIASAVNNAEVVTDFLLDALQFLHPEDEAQIDRNGSCNSHVQSLYIPFCCRYLSFTNSGIDTCWSIVVGFKTLHISELARFTTSRTSELSVCSKTSTTRSNAGRPITAGS